MLYCLYFFTSTGSGTNPVPGAPKTGTVSPNSPIQNPTTDEEKKQAWYIANAQGYCLEFRLSENTVNSYATYCTERGSYEDPYGLHGGSWFTFRNWLVLNSFTCTWKDNTKPVKNGTSALWDAIAGKLKGLNMQLGAPGSDILWCGMMDGVDGGDHTDATDPDPSTCFYALYVTGGTGHDWGMDSTKYILLVRPL